jgi:hypothetical protein
MPVRLEHVNILIPLRRRRQLPVPIFRYRYCGRQGDYFVLVRPRQECVDIALGSEPHRADTVDINLRRVRAEDFK